MTRIALLGAGAMGSIMARDIYPTLRDNVEVTAVIDRHADRRDMLAAELGAHSYASLADALVAEQLDGVDIRLQHAAHADAAEEALTKGLHVLVEKPVALTLADCARVSAASARADRVVAVAENYPHLKAVRAARAAIDAGRVGELLAIRTTRAYTLDGVWANTAWRQGSSPMAGLLWDQGTHHTSMLRALAGEIVAVSAQTARGRKTEGAEVNVLSLRFASGLIGQSLYCWGTPGRPTEVEGTVLGSTGAIDITVDYDSDDGRARLTNGEDGDDLSAGEGYYDSHRSIVIDWLDAIDRGRDPRVPIASATADVEVVLAANESVARGGTEVHLEEIR